MVRRFLDVLVAEGFIDTISDAVDSETGFSFLDVGLRYLQDGRPLIATCTRVSKPGRRVYCGTDSLKQKKSGLGIAVISTSKGIMSDRQAKRYGIGGEVLAIIG
jgi:small subunit ribosomal protein S8